MVEANGTSTAAARALPAIVKAVPSGDTVLVMGADSSRGPPPEKLISLTGITAPRLANRSTDDSPWAWASRDFLRRLVIGKPVTFVIEAPASTVPGGPTGGPPPEFGTVYFEGLPLQQPMLELLEPRLLAGLDCGSMAFATIHRPPAGAQKPRG